MIARGACPGGCGRWLDAPTVICGECFATVSPILKPRIWQLVYQSRMRYETRRGRVRDLLDHVKIVAALKHRRALRLFKRTFHILDWTRTYDSELCRTNIKGRHRAYREYLKALGLL